ncbi:MAG: hypothetical protein WCD18_13760 [Thermosynechococcaceae cyanobacterium]
MNFYKELYLGWLVLVVKEEFWYFESHKPDGESYYDPKPFANEMQALSAAKYYVQRSIAQKSIQNALFDLQYKDKN